VNIFLRADPIREEDGAIALELTMRETGVDGENIKIMPMK
jgi:hypothetical protein